MLEAIGESRIDDLFDEIPKNLLINSLPGVPVGMCEADITRLMGSVPCAMSAAGVLGAGAYEHHIPAAVWEIATRGEFYSAYTPYQAEASQARCSCFTNTNPCLPDSRGWRFPMPRCMTEPLPAPKPA